LTDLIQNVKSKIYEIRGQKVMLDRDLSDLYGVTTGNLNKAVKRNPDRFPYSFMFQITKNEVESLRFQFGSANISNKSRSLPHVFTEHGTLMLASILKSDIAIKINQSIIKAFIATRKLMTTQPEYELLKKTIERIESNVNTRLDLGETSHLIDNTVLSTKMTNLSQAQARLKQDVQRISQVLDEFQNTNIIIKRPDEEIEG
jgi:hypothetical protein